MEDVYGLTPLATLENNPNYIIFPSICCAFRYNYCEQDCFGLVGRWRMCYLTSEAHACRADCYNHESCCILGAGDTEIVTGVPNDCRCYRRCCCLELMWGVPWTGYLRPHGIDKVLSKEGKEVLTEVIPIANGTCCNFVSLYISFPGFLSYYSQRYCLCSKEDVVLCKPMCNNPAVKDNRLKCILCKRTSTLSQNIMCCKCIDQVLCLDHRCSIPTDEDVPCLLTLVPFCVVCVNWRCVGVKCCKQVGALEIDANLGRVAPIAQAQAAAVTPMAQVMHVPSPSPDLAPAPSPYTQTTPYSANAVSKADAVVPQNMQRSSIPGVGGNAQYSTVPVSSSDVDLVGSQQQNSLYNSAAEDPR